MGTRGKIVDVIPQVPKSSHWPPPDISFKLKKKKARLENRKAKDTRLQIFKILRLYNDNKN